MITYDNIPQKTVYHKNLLKTNISLDFIGFPCLVSVNAGCNNIQFTTPSTLLHYYSRDKNVSYFKTILVTVDTISAQSLIYFLKLYYTFCSTGKNVHLIHVFLYSSLISIFCSVYCLINTLMFQQIILYEVTQQHFILVGNIYPVQFFLVQRKHGTVVGRAIVMANRFLVRFPLEEIEY